MATVDPVSFHADLLTGDTAMRQLTLTNSGGSDLEWATRLSFQFPVLTFTLTADERPVPGYFWSQDSKYVLYVQDKDGDENFHVYAVDPAADSDEDTDVPPARNLTPMDGVRAVIYAVPKATPERMLVGLNDRDPALHDVYSLEIASGELELLIENDANVAAWVPDLQGQVRLAVRQTSDGGTETLEVKEGRLGDVLYECSWQESCGPMRFHPDGNRVYFQPNPDCPFLPELQGLLVKTAGVVDTLREVLSRFATRLDWAFVYGSMARAEELAKEGGAEDDARAMSAYPPTST